MKIRKRKNSFLKRTLKFLKAVRHPLIVIPLTFFSLTMLVLSVERIALLTTLPERFAHVSFYTIAKAFVVGLRFDCVVAAMAAAPIVLILCFCPSAVWRQKWFRLSVSMVLAVLVSVIVFGSVFDFYFFKEFDTRLDWKVFNYYQYDYIYKIMWTQYPVGILLASLAGLLAISFVGFKHPALWRNETRMHSRIAMTLLAPLLIACGIRNSFGPKPINTGPAYFSSQSIVAQFTLNGFFTLREAAYNRFARKGGQKADTQWEMKKSEALSKVKNMVKTERDTFLDNSQNPLDRITDTGKSQNSHNVVIVVMESLSWPYIGALGGKQELTPNLNEIARNGILMDRCFAVGGRTTYGFSGIVSGFPDLPSESVGTRQRAENNFLTMPGILKKRGYQTMFVYGGQAMYDHRQAFLGSNGVDELVTEEDFSHTTYETELGWCDGDLFREAHHQFKKASKKKDPFFSLLLTLSFHRPYKIPSGKIKPVLKENSNGIDKQLTCVKYTDWAIGQFLDKAEQSDYFDDTIFVFVADHTGGDEGHPVAPPNYRIPFIIYAPDIIGTEKRRVSKICSQTDLAPTVLSLLGGKYQHSFFGSNVLADNNRENYAFLRNGGHGMAYIDEDMTGAIVPFNGKSSLFRYKPPDSADYLEKLTKNQKKQLDKYRRKSIAINKAAWTLFERGSYNLEGQNEEGLKDNSRK